MGPDQAGLAGSPRGLLRVVLGMKASVLSSAPAKPRYRVGLSVLDAISGDYNRCGQEHLPIAQENSQPCNAHTPCSSSSLR